MRFSTGIIKGLTHSSALVAIVAAGVSGIPAAVARAAEEAPSVSFDVMEIPRPALDLVQGFLEEAVTTGDIPLEQAREKGYSILDKYFGKALGDQYFMDVILEKVAPEMTTRPDLKAVANLKTPVAKLEKAMAQAFFRESAWRLFVQTLRSIRETEKTNLSESILFFDETLRLKLLANPLSFSIEKLGSGVVRRKTGAVDYIVKVKLIPEVDEFGKSVDVSYVVRKDHRGNYNFVDFHFGTDLSALTMHFTVGRSMFLNSAKTGNPVSDLVYSRMAAEAMQRFGIDEAKWKMLALDFVH